MSEYLLDRLTEYVSSDAYPLHMPGHKRQISHFEHPFSIDITEIEGFDNLHHPEGILLQAQERAARLYGADATYYLVNGSTCGILAAVSASVRRGGRILMARNSHKAAYHAAFLNGLHVTWLYPEADSKRVICGSIHPEQVREALTEKNARISDGINTDGYTLTDRIQAVFITSPTYDGVVSDIRSIAEEVHRAGAILIVDEAHGAHFAMHPYFPQSALACGADIVINSLHKTMPSLTQTALLHVKGALADRERIKKYLGIYQSSSPSYVLMTGIDECIRMMAAQSQELFDRFVQRLERLRAHLETMKVLHLVSGAEPELAAFAFDRSKILISTEKCRAMDLLQCGGEKAGFHSVLTGADLGDILRRHYHLEVEMEADRYATAIMTVSDTQEGFDRLEAALLEIDEALWETAKEARLAKEGRPEEDKCRMDLPEGVGCGEAVLAEDAACLWKDEMQEMPHPETVMTMEEADCCLWEPVPLEKSPGRIAAESAYLYPPGIPLFVPGERIPEELPELLAHYQKLGLKVQGLEDYSVKTIQCVSENDQTAI